jgi:hypothetical protein
LEEWRVEEIDADGHGGIATATFTGAFAEERARGYAEQLRGRQRRKLRYCAPNPSAPVVSKFLLILAFASLAVAAAGAMEMELSMSNVSSSPNFDGVASEAVIFATTH